MTWVPTAKQAREEAEKYYLARCVDAIDEVYDCLECISNASKIGKFRVIVKHSYHLEPLTIKAMKRLGYSAPYLGRLSYETEFNW